MGSVASVNGVTGGVNNTVNNTVNGVTGGLNNTVNGVTRCGQRHAQRRQPGCLRAS